MLFAGVSIGLGYAGIKEHTKPQQAKPPVRFRLDKVSRGARRFPICLNAGMTGGSVEI
jgi:hypothetical protein